MSIDVINKHYKQCSVCVLYLSIYSILIEYSNILCVFNMLACLTPVSLLFQQSLFSCFNLLH